MAFSQTVKDQALARAGNRCECTRNCSHHPNRRCNAVLTTGGWEAHHKMADATGGSDTLSNCEALCIQCHQNTRSYGRP
jgi:5-methylcytosine-specific restriction endonuclease McrA